MGQTTDFSKIPLTPMLTQYLDIKRQYTDAIVFYRMGDFYEMFLDDAVTAAPLLDLALTSRDKSAEHPIPMCGVPYHSVTPYIQKLISKGFKVALCEQVEDPAAAKGLVRREVIRVVTPSLVGDPDLVSDESTQLLFCVRQKEDDRKSEKFKVEVATFDLFADELKTGEIDSFREWNELLIQRSPREILVDEMTAAQDWFRNSLVPFPNILVTIRTSYFGEKNGVVCVDALNRYLEETQKLKEVVPPHALPLLESTRMDIESPSIAALEILPVHGRPETTTLFKVLDTACTPMGRRLLKEWIGSPSRDRTEIECRLDAVEELIENSNLRRQLEDQLRNIRDLERLTTKVSLGLAMPRDLVAIREIQTRIPLVQQTLLSSKSALLRSLGERLDLLTEITRDLTAALLDSPASTLRDGGIFRDSYRPEISELRALSNDAKSKILEMELNERSKTGISTLKIKHNKVFGYTIEVTKSHLEKVPSNYIRKQTISTGERFFTEELKVFEEKTVTAEVRLRSLEEGLFLELRIRVGSRSVSLHQNSRMLGELDVLICFAKVAREQGYCRPKFHSEPSLMIQDGRHPVVETLFPRGKFVPNSLSLNADDCRTIIITGPNMGGKSTIMRQVALIVLMAQMGSFVPATHATLPVFDAIFTRIGSSDDLTHGRSTFMVEMNEIARILSRATPQSLILIDEIGRGTSTYDGLSLAWSILEFIHSEIKAKTLFATHFHELTSLEKSLPGIRNANVLVEKWNDGIVFLYQLAPGVCNRSYGIEVAHLAGLPAQVLFRAREIQGVLETQSQRATKARQQALTNQDNQMVFFDEPIRPETLTGFETP